MHWYIVCDVSLTFFLKVWKTVFFKIFASIYLTSVSFFQENCEI